MKLVVGLGNIGANYVNTRHNVGFWLVDKLVQKYGANLAFSKKHNAEVDKILTPYNVVIAKPHTFMNNSGMAVQSIAKWYQIASQDILVIHDEMAFKCGQVKFAQNHGANGQNGVQSVINHIGKNFARVRIGIGKESQNDDRVNFVLGTPSKEEIELINTSIDLAINGIELWLSSGIDKAMNYVNGVKLDDSIKEI